MGLARALCQSHYGAQDSDVEAVWVLGFRVLGFRVGLIITHTENSSST